jgi:hypothetical protein
LFPETEKLLVLERKYGDSLNHEDLFGVVKPKKKKMAPDGTVTGESPEKAPDAGESKLADSMLTGTMEKNLTNIDTKTVKYQRDNTKRKADTDANN